MNSKKKKKHKKIKNQANKKWQQCIGRQSTEETAAPGAIFPSK